MRETKKKTVDDIPISTRVVSHKFRLTHLPIGRHVAKLEDSETSNVIIKRFKSGERLNTNGPLGLQPKSHIG
ncbi:hypothetical protein Ddye_001329 [Dipteronia dyeriana]|uniref:Uncharacterized protein n=1 Tax=Dipteronia dyeriana TaxID=168575 RepID=A0AAE0CT94_9ROSI|nr:hypothetical protein Ddye_001329 [Dipteronia dyeriana]